MRNLKQLIYNPETMLYEVHEQPRIRRYLLVAAMVAVGAGLIGLYFWLYTSVFGLTLPKTVRLRKENAQLVSRLEILTHELNRYEGVLQGIENRDDDVYKTLFGLSEVSSASASPSVVYRKYLDYEQMGASPSLLETSRRIDDMSRRVILRRRSLAQVDEVSVQAEDRISHIPAVPPLRPDGFVRRSSGFGSRTDPVFGGRRFHEGQDFATRKGTPVYATGDAVVEKVQYQFFGYGNMVVLNHGFGYKTRYAHLKTILVQAGQEIHRGDKIGEVGNSGKSTGPHLHYEVEINGKRVNPSNYYDMTMNVAEYDAMVRERAAASARPDIPSTGDILKRKRLR